MKLSLVLLLIALPTAAQPSTNKHHTTSPSPQSVKKLLIAHAWRIQNATMMDGRTMGEIESGKLHAKGNDGDMEIDTVVTSNEIRMTMTFRADGTFMISVHLPGFSEEEKGWWKLSSDQTQITLTEKEKQSRTYQIDKLDNNHATLSSSGSSESESEGDDEIVKYELVPRD